MTKYKNQMLTAIIAMVFGAGGGIGGDMLLPDEKVILTDDNIYEENIETIDAPGDLPDNVEGYVYSITVIWKAEDTAIPGLDRHYDQRTIKVKGEVAMKQIPSMLKPRFPGYKLEQVLELRKIGTILEEEGVK